jgi:hypothetical protein
VVVLDKVSEVVDEGFDVIDFNFGISHGEENPIELLSPDLYS